MRKTKISALNAFTGLIMVIIKSLTQFVLIRIFIESLGSSIFGFDQFMLKTLEFLSLAELGVGNVIGFSLYKPIAEKNKKKIISLMQFYRRIYSKIGITVLIIGILISPFFGLFIENEASKTNFNFLYVSYFLFLITTSSSYFFSYNQTFLIVSQKAFILNIIKTLFLIIGTIILISVIRFSSNYLFYLLIWCILKVLENISCYIFVRLKHKYIFSKTKFPLKSDDKKKINKNIKALIAHKIGGTFVLNSNLLILRIFNNFSTVGFFAYYETILSAVYLVITQIFDGIKASFGDYNVKNNNQKTKIMFLNLQFLSFLISSWCSVFLINICEPFICIWIGKDKQLSFIALCLFVLNFYLRSFRIPLDLLKDINGIYWQDRYKPLVEAFVKIFFSVFLGWIFGLEGVIAGTTISLIGVLLVVEPYIVYKYLFQEKPLSYFFVHVKCFIFTAFMCFLSFFLSLAITTEIDNIFLILIRRFLVSFFLPPILFFAFLRKKQEFRFLFSVFKNFTKINVS
ncbi:MAG: hypothetical protein LBF33_01465 [Oscillospiraceae bacterium]|jgi:O-antigen/teichoic acid export membrane protein|nr:hypothetical protein [Oscillospiraceae bacterium]